MKGARRVVVPLARAVLKGNSSAWPPAANRLRGRKRVLVSASARSARPLPQLSFSAAQLIHRNSFSTAGTGGGNGGAAVDGVIEEEFEDDDGTDEICLGWREEYTAFLNDTDAWKDIGAEDVRERFKHLANNFPENQRVYTRWAKFELKQGDTEMARKVLRKAVKVDSKKYSAWLLLARIEQRLGNVELAIKYTKVALRADPTNVKLLHVLGSLFLDQKDEESAVECFESILDTAPDDLVARIELMYLSQDEEETAQRRKNLLGILRQNIENKYLWQKWLRMEYSEHGLEAARKVFRDAQEADAASPHLMHVMATLELQEQHVHEARELLVKAVEADQHDPFLWMALIQAEEKAANVDLVRNLFDEALKQFNKSDHFAIAAASFEQRQGNMDKALRILGGVQPDASAERLNALGHLLLKLGKDEDAREKFRLALERDSNHVHSITSLATLERKSGNLEEAHRIASEAYSSHPTDTSVIQTLAQIELARGQNGRAYELLKEALELNKFDGHALHSIATLSLEYDPEVTLEVLSDVIEDQPASQATYSSSTKAILLTDRGRAYAKLRQFGKANADFEAAIALQDSHPLRVHFANCLQQQDRLEEALKHALHSEKHLVTTAEEQDFIKRYIASLVRNLAKRIGFEANQKALEQLGSMSPGKALLTTKNALKKLAELDHYPELTSGTVDTTKRILLTTTAMALSNLKKNTKATAAFQEALSHEDHIQVVNKFAEFCFQRKRYDDAIKLYRRMIEGSKAKQYKGQKGFPGEQHIRKRIADCNSRRKAIAAPSSHQHRTPNSKPLPASAE